MKKIAIAITSFLLFSTSLVFGEWHDWDEPPEQDQLYMWVEISPGKQIEERQILHIQHYDELNPQFQYLQNGWWDVTPETVWQWLQEGNKIIYFP